MEIKKSFEILELDPNASVDEAKQAYKDIVNVWHPDRFSHNSRLKEKAEEKLKEVNVAYETVNSFLSSKKGLRPRPDQAPQAKTATSERTEAKTKPDSESGHQNFQGEARAEDKTEAVAETGTRIFLEVCSFLYSSLRRIIAFEAKISALSKAIEQAHLNTWFASESYVLTTNGRRRDHIIQKARKHGIGVWPHPSELSSSPLVSATQRRVPSRRAVRRPR